MRFLQRQENLFSTPTGSSGTDWAEGGLPVGSPNEAGPQPHVGRQNEQVILVLSLARAVLGMTSDQGSALSLSKGFSA